MAALNKVAKSDYHWI